jgi:hypothetical protein
VIRDGIVVLKKKAKIADGTRIGLAWARRFNRL